MPPDLPPSAPDEAAALFAMALDTTGEHPGDGLGPHALTQEAPDDPAKVEATRRACMLRTNLGE